jgi:DNA repair and recombination protein RAD52
VKVEPSRWDVDKLHRHHDYAPLPKEPIKTTSTETITGVDTEPMRTMSEQSRVSLATTDIEDEYGGNLFDEVDFSHPDEVFLDTTDTEITDAKMTEQVPEVSKAPERQALSRAQSIPAMRTSNAGQSPGPNQVQMRKQQQGRPFQQQQQQPPRAGPVVNGQPNNRPIPPSGRMLPPVPNGEHNQQQKPTEVPHQQLPQSRATSSTPEQLPPNQQRPQPHQFNAQQNNGGPPAHEPPVGFITARIADKVQGPTVITPNIQGMAFNPHAESPSIRKTTGIDHRRSAPINRQVVTAGPPNVLAQPGPGNAGMMPNRPTNFVNPQADVSRRIGMPVGGQSPLANRGAYKPPGPAGIKRGLPEGNSTVAGRLPLADMSNLQQNQPQQDGGGDVTDAKRQKIGGGT